VELFKYTEITPSRVKIHHLSSQWLITRHQRDVTSNKLEAKDVLPNTNCTQAAKRAIKMPVFVPGDIDL